MSLSIGQRVEIIGKDCQGVIAYIGHPTFAAGKWIGVILDEPMGRNNGTIKGHLYFKVIS
jgi:dynactin 1